MKQNIEKVVLKGCFFWFFLALHYLCHSVAKVLPLEKAKKILLFPRLALPLRLRREGTPARKSKKDFAFSSLSRTFAET